MSKQQINRTKIVLVVKGKANHWLVNKLDKHETTISKWRTNDVQLSLKILSRIEEVLNVKVLRIIA